MGGLHIRIVVNGTDHSFQRELGCTCGRCQKPHFRGNTSVSVIAIDSGRSKDEAVWHALIDAGSGAINNLYDNLATYRNSPPRVDMILLTHWHPDHTLGLNQLCEGLRRSRTAQNLSTGRIPIWCRSKTWEFVSKTHEYEVGKFLERKNQFEDTTESPGRILNPLKPPDLQIEGIEIQPITISHSTADFAGNSTAGFVISSLTSGRRAALLWAALYTQLIHDAERCLMSAANFVELSIVIEGQMGPDAGRQCDVFFRRAGIIIEPFTVEQAHLARQAFLDFGKGRHAAGLNLGDCFAYALAKITGEPLLFKGEDFKKTDISSAL